MKQKVFSWVVVVGVLALAGLEFSLWAQTAGGGGGAATIRAELVDRVSTKELWHSAPPVTYRSTGGVFISYWAADRENQPWADDWVSPGFVVAGRGDIGERPVAIRIWTKASDRFLLDPSLAESEESRNAVGLFGSSAGEVRLRFSVTPDGEAFVDGNKVGTVE